GYLLSEVDFDPFLPDNTVKISHKKTLIGPRFKLIRDDPTSTFQLYDLEADPKEERDLAPREPGKVKELAALLKERLARNRAAAPSPEKVRLNDEQIKILRSLGYVGREEKHPPGKGRKKKK
ncbi:MAG: hypothetical protein ACE5IM_11350, partial [Nitrospinota bacterium]